MKKSKELKVAIKAAKKAGKILKYYFRNEKLEVKSKGGTDITTEADEKSEKKIIEILKKEFPKYQVIAEESGFHKSESDYRWIIDPLDGTLVYSRGFPEFAISISLQKDNESILGVIYNPITNEMYYAEKGKGAFLNRKPIHVSNKDKLIKSLIGTGFVYNRFIYGEEMNKHRIVLNEIAKNSKMLKTGGSAALEMCYVASGREEGYWELTIKPWDIAAGKLIVEEAGGKVTSGKDDNFDVMNPICIASNGLIHNDLQKIIQKYL